MKVFIQKNNLVFVVYIMVFVFVLQSCVSKEELGTKISRVWLIGDSTMANYALEDNYMANKYPITGWGQVFQLFMAKDSITKIKHLVGADSLVVDDCAAGGRSTRTFFQEGRWRAVYNEIKKGDLVLMQFGHNDASKQKSERYVNIEGYKEFLRLFVQQTREMGGLPILLTPVARNYPWEEGHLENVHGEYPDAMKEVASEMSVLLIDLNQLSMDSFSAKGKEYVSKKYFMNLPAGIYDAYPEGQDDNTHFQMEGSTEVARLVYQGMTSLKN